MLIVKYTPHDLPEHKLDRVEKVGLSWTITAYNNIMTGIKWLHNSLFPVGFKALYNHLLYIHDYVIGGYRLNPFSNVNNYCMRQIHSANTGVNNQRQQLIYFAIFDPRRRSYLTSWHAGSALTLVGLDFPRFLLHCTASAGFPCAPLLLVEVTHPAWCWTLCIMHLSFDVQQIKISNNS